MSYPRLVLASLARFSMDVVRCCLYKGLSGPQDAACMLLWPGTDVSSQGREDDRDIRLFARPPPFGLAIAAHDLGLMILMV